MAAPPPFEQFRLEMSASGVAHLVFDAPGRTMNVFCNTAIAELGAFVAWLRTSEVKGVVLRSGKSTGFCAGADLGELGAAYNMIMAAPVAQRSQIAFDHFFRLSQAIRGLETAGKPVAAAIAGLALGGGCELALGAHYRVATTSPKAAFGLPESLVGLLPGGGGTQRMPRLIGLEPAMPILLNGARLSGEAARAAGLIDELVEESREVAAAEAWVLSAPSPQQPWDRADRRTADRAEVAGRIAAERERVLAQTLGHYPAPLAILDCVEQGLPRSMDDGLRGEMRIFAELIQRREPRNMIQTLFLGKLDYERAQGVFADVRAVIDEFVELSKPAADNAAALAAAGFSAGASAAPVRDRAAPGYWFDEPGDTPEKAAVRAHLARICEAAARRASSLSAKEQRMVDYAVVTQGGYPAYLGGPFSYLAAS